MSYPSAHGQPYDESWPNYNPAPEYPPDYGPYGHPVPQPGWGFDPRFVAPPVVNPVPAFASAALFLACAIQSFVFAFSTWGSESNPHLLAALVGIIFSGDITGNSDFAISATMTVACSTTTFALALFARLNFVRWILVAIGTLVTVYYFFALLYIAANGGARVVAVPTVALLLWAAATTVALLPATAQAMRGRT